MSSKESPFRPIPPSSMKFDKEAAYEHAKDVDAMILRTVKMYESRNPNNAMGYLAFIRTVETTLVILKAETAFALDLYKKQSRS